MRRIALSVIILTLAACAASERSSTAAMAQHEMVGMSAEQVLACMGVPGRKAHEGKTEVWAYKSTNDQTDGMRSSYRSPLGLSIGEGSSSKSNCTVNVVLNEKRVVAVHYTGPRGTAWAPDEQCSFAVDNCVHKAPAQ